MAAPVDPSTEPCVHDHDHQGSDGVPGPAGGLAPGIEVPPSRAPRWTGPVVVGALAVAATAYTAWQDPNADGVFPQCPTRELFGFDCPGCGGLRAVHALTRGDIVASFDHNVLVPILLPLAIVAWGVWLLHSLGRTVPRLPRPSKPVLAGIGVFLLAFTIVRNIGGVGLFEYLHSTT